MYLERRRRLWYALHTIPADLRKVLGRSRFVESLETNDEGIAKRRAAVKYAQWLRELEAARPGTPKDRIETDAAFWKRAIAETPEPEREVVRSLLADEARDMVDRAGAKAGILDDRDPAYAELPENAEASRFYAIATGKLARLDEHLEEYVATLSNEAKTKDMKRSTIRKFCASFTYVGDVRRADVQRWANDRAVDGWKPATLKRALSELRGYWGYLQSLEVASEDHLPFEKLSIPKPTKNGKADEREPFKAVEVVKLWKAARDNDDAQLADLIELGMWTGARLEEICAMPADKAHADHLEIRDAKTPAGWRQVPIHPKLKVVVQRLRKASADGFLLAGLKPNKYGDRSNAIGKRFGKLKTKLGFGKRHVFHSIRRTVATQLENAGVPENVSADILGHDKPTMTYGLYSGGASMATKRDAIKKLRYPLSS
jgi:integrase